MHACCPRLPPLAGCSALPARHRLPPAGLPQDTECDLAKKLWEENSEMAIHSKTHIPLNASFTPGAAAELLRCWRCVAAARVPAHRCSGAG